MVSKKVGLVSLLLLVFYGGVLCAGNGVSALKAGEEPEFFDLVNKKAGFTISVPQNWDTAQKFFGAMTMLISPDGASLNVVLDELADEITTKEYVDKSDSEYPKMFKKFEQHQREPFVSEDLMGILSTYSYERDGKRTKLMQVVFAFGRRVYVLSCGADVDLYPKYEPVFRKIVGSFKLTK